MSVVELFRASLAHTPQSPFQHPNALECHHDGGLLVQHGRVVAAGDYGDLQRQHPDAITHDWRGGLILPGFVDTHVHFPQLRVLGSLGLSLLEWLEHAALPEEARMSDIAYADTTARRFVTALAAHGTTTALVFGAHFAGATAALFEAADRSGLRVVSGLVLSDRRLRDDLHQSPSSAYEQSCALIRRFHKHGRLLYAVTPRFALSTSEAMLETCQSLMAEYPDVRFQTHINENPAKIAAVRELFPWSRDYLDVYERFALSGPRSVLAHSVWSTAAELERMAATGASVAHCPCSNAALGSGVFPLRRHLNAGVHVSLGTDVGGGTGFGMAKEGLYAYLTHRVAPDSVALDPGQMLYLATKAGAEALGLGDETGDFSTGKSADFVCVRPLAGSVLADVLTRAESVPRMLAAVFTLAGAESVHEVRVGGTRVSAREGDPLEALGV